MVDEKMEECAFKLSSVSLFLRAFRLKIIKLIINCLAALKVAFIRQLKCRQKMTKHTSVLEI